MGGSLCKGGGLRNLVVMVVAAWVFVASVAGCASRECDFRQPIANSSESPDGNSGGERHELYDLYVVRHRWHTGVAIPAQHLDESLAFLPELLGKAKYYEIGWGDEGFYKASGIEAGLTLRALLWPTETVLHVVALDDPPVDYPHTDILTLSFSAPALRDLQRAMVDTFARQPDGQPVVLEPGLYGQSLFFRARGTFWFGNTCNSWTARVLDEAGLATGPLPVLSASGLMRRVQRQASRCEN